MPKSIIEVLLQYGGLGAVLLVVGWAYFKKDKALVEDGKAYAKALQDEQQLRIADAKAFAQSLQEEQQLRISDAKQYLELAMRLQESVIAAVNKLSDIVEVYEKRESAREIHDAHRDEERRQPKAR